MKVGVLGSGVVAQTLSIGFQKHGHEVMIGSREPAKLQAWAAEKAEGVKVGDFAETAAFGDIVVLAVKGTAAASAVALAGNLSGKIVIDTTNPIADLPPVNGILQYFTGANDSLMEKLQAQAPEAHFVKAFNSVGSHFFVNPNFGTRPTMFICGNSAEAKATVTQILDSFGWDSEDIGKVEGARALEPLCQLWCAPGFQRNQWTHAFKLLKL